MYATGPSCGVAVGEIRNALAELSRRLDPAVLTLTEAKASLGEVVALKKMAAAIEGRLARRVAEAGEWERAGFASPEAWLSQQTGEPLGRAREALATAERLEGLPDLTEAANGGELSAEQTAMIADAATADPSAERRLVESARHKPLSKLRDECAATKRAADHDPEAAHRRIHAARMLRFSRALDGAARLIGATTPEQMASIKAAVERRGNELFDEARREGRREPREAYLMDALAQICDEWLRGQATDLVDDLSTAGSGRDAEPADSDITQPSPVGSDEAGTSETTQCPPADAAKRRRVPPGYLGLLRLDLEALWRGHVAGEELCEIAGLGPVPVSVARRLLGDAVVKLLITKGRDVLDVTHLGRGPTVAQKMALLWGSPGCVITGCPRMAGIQHDHRIEWRHTHHTVIDELDRLCDHHHDLKTYKGWAAVRRPDGTVVMVPPTDPRHLRRQQHHQPNRTPAPRDRPEPPEP